MAAPVPCTAWWQRPPWLHLCSPLGACLHSKLLRGKPGWESTVQQLVPCGRCYRALTGPACGLLGSNLPHRLASTPKSIKPKGIAGCSPLPRRAVTLQTFSMEAWLLPEPLTISSCSLEIFPQVHIPSLPPACFFPVSLFLLDQSQEATCLLHQLSSLNTQLFPSWV